MEFLCSVDKLVLEGVLNANKDVSIWRWQLEACGHEGLEECRVDGRAKTCNLQHTNVDAAFSKYQNYSKFNMLNC